MKVGCIYTVVIDRGKLYVDGALQRRPDRKLLRFMADEKLTRAGVVPLPGGGFRALDNYTGGPLHLKGRKAR